MAENRAAKSDDEKAADRSAAVLETAATGSDSVARPAGRTDVATPGRAARTEAGPDDGSRKTGPRVLHTGTHVRSPETGEVQYLPAGSEAPSWATDASDDQPPLVGEHLLGEPGDSQDEPSVDVFPGPDNEVPSAKAGRARWAAYASGHGVIVQAGASKDDILAALEDAGVETK